MTENIYIRLTRKFEKNTCFQFCQQQILWTSMQTLKISATTFGFVAESNFFKATLELGGRNVRFFIWQINYVWK